MRYKLTEAQDDELWNGPIWDEYYAARGYTQYFSAWVHERYGVVLLDDYIVEGTADAITWLLLHL